MDAVFNYAAFQVSNSYFSAIIQLKKIERSVQLGSFRMLRSKTCPSFACYVKKTSRSKMHENLPKKN